MMNWIIWNSIGAVAGIAVAIVYLILRKKTTPICETCEHCVMVMPKTAAYRYITDWRCPLRSHSKVPKVCKCYMPREVDE